MTIDKVYVYEEVSRGAVRPVTQNPTGCWIDFVLWMAEFDCGARVWSAQACLRLVSRQLAAARQEPWYPIWRTRSKCECFQPWYRFLRYSPPRRLHCDTREEPGWSRRSGRARDRSALPVVQGNVGGGEEPDAGVATLDEVSRIVVGEQRTAVPIHCEAGHVRLHRPNFEP